MITTTTYKHIPEINDYVELVEKAGQGGRKKVCELQKKLIKFVKKVFKEEELFIDTDQLHNYMKLEKYFRFKLFPWEKFVFTLP